MDWCTGNKTRQVPAYCIGADRHLDLPWRISLVCMRNMHEPDSYMVVTQSLHCSPARKYRILVGIVVYSAHIHPLPLPTLAPM